MTDRERDDRLLASATDRFERRLSEEISGVRQEVSALRADMIEQDALIRLEIANLKVEMTEQFGAVRLGAETKHRELLKWALVFWVGQAASVAAIVSALN